MEHDKSANSFWSLFSIIVAGSLILSLLQVKATGVLGNQILKCRIIKLFLLNVSALSPASFIRKINLQLKLNVPALC